MQAGQTPIIRTPNPAVQQIRAQVGISGQQRIAGSLLANPRIATSQQMMQVQARALAAQAQAQGQPIPTSLAATAAPALQAHLAPTYNAVRASSTSPGLPQQSPPLHQAVAASATSPRPPSAQAMGGMNPQLQAALANAQRPVPSLAHYYQNASLNPPIPSLTNEQIAQAMQVRGLLQVSRALAAALCNLTIILAAATTTATATTTTSAAATTATAAAAATARYSARAPSTGAAAAGPKSVVSQDVGAALSFPWSSNLVSSILFTLFSLVLYFL